MHHHGVDKEKLKQQLQAMMQSRMGIEDTTGLDLMFTLHRVNVMSNMYAARDSEDVDLSGPRWWLMLRLFFDEETGNTEGITPSALSHSQSVSRNTISVLLRGLESQELIQRVTDPRDLRTFRIRLSPKGRDVIMKTAPARVDRLNRLYSILSDEERTSLLAILNKLNRFLLDGLHCSHDVSSPEE